MFNIALGLVFSLSIINSLGAMVLVKEIPSEALHSMPAYLKLIVKYSVSYWVPTIVVYLILRLIRADLFPKSSKVISFVVGGANAIIVVFLCLRVLASTIEGGGVTYALGIIAAPVIPFVKVFLCIGIVMLVANSIWYKLRVESPSISSYPPILKSTSGIIAVIMLFPPIVLVGVVYLNNIEKISASLENRSQFESRFNKLCSTAKAEVYKKIEKPVSAYFNTPNQYGALLKELEYVEVKLRKNYFQRLTLKDEHKEKERFSNKDVERTPIADVASRYHVIESWPHNEEDKKLGIISKVTKIIDSKTNSTLAHYEKISHVKRSRAIKECPKNYYSLRSSIQRYVFGLTNELESEVTVLSKK